MSRSRKTGRGYAAKVGRPSDGAHLSPPDVENERPMPAAWRAVNPRLVAGSRPVANTENEAGQPRSMTNLVAEHPRHGKTIVLAEDMEFASWDDAFDHVQARLCQDPTCGYEGCASGSWVSARLVRDDELTAAAYPQAGETRCDEPALLVELGPSRHWDLGDDWAAFEHAPPRWMLEVGPVQLTLAEWERLVNIAPFRLQRPSADL